jgi:hypothetical protein
MNNDLAFFLKWTIPLSAAAWLLAAFTTHLVVNLIDFFN